MTEESRDNENTVSIKRSQKRIQTLFFIVFALFLCLLFWKYFFYQSVDKKLAAFEAARAIDDSENAAVHYRRFFSEPNNVLALEDLSSYTPSGSREPWQDDELPELASLLETHRQFIETLLDISEMQEARFQVYPDPMSDWNNMFSAMRKVTFVLSWAAANDLAEGRIDEALQKYRCQLKLAQHLQQQPAAYYRFVGIAIEAVAFGNIRRAAMRDEITTEQLRSLETILKIPLERDEVVAEVADKVDLLIEEKEMSALSLIARFKYWLLGRTTRASRRQSEKMQRLRLDASQQATRILIALRRHKEQTGDWPESLEQIEPKPPEQMLTDPQNNGHFVYKRDGDDFIFYSKGPNGIDESGSSSGSADDWPIWPLKYDNRQTRGSANDK